MKHTIIIFFSVLQFMHANDCAPVIRNNIDYSLDLSFFIDSTLENYSKSFKISIPNDDFENNIKITSSALNLSYVIYSMSGICDENIVINEGTIVDKETSINLAFLSKGDSYLIKFIVPIKDDPFIKIRKNYIPISTCNDVYNYANSKSNPINLEIDSENFIYQDCNIGTIKKDGAYTKWYKLLDSPYNKYVSVELQLSDPQNSQLDIYFYSNRKFNKVNMNHLYDGTTNCKVPFIFLGDGKQYYLKVAKNTSSFENYEIQINTISNLEFDLEKITQDTITYGKVANLIDAPNSRIKPGDTIFVDYTQYSWLPFNQSWFHSLTIEENPNIQPIDISNVVNTSTSEDGVFKTVQWQQRIDSFPIGSYKGKGHYFLNQTFGPKALHPKYSWGTKPNLELMNLDDEDLKLRHYYVVDKNLDCLNQSELELIYNINTDYETGSYNFKEVLDNQSKLVIPIECCEPLTIADPLLICHGDKARISINSKDKFLPIYSADQLKLVKLSKNDYEITFIDTTSTAFETQLEFHSENNCNSIKQYRIVKLEKKQVKIFKESIYKNNYTFNKNELGNITSVEWSQEGKQVGNEEIVSLRSQNNSNLLKIKILDENNCPLESSTKLDSKEYFNIYDFSINPNPTIKDFTLEIMLLSQDEYKSAKKESFNLNILYSNGEVAENIRNLSLGTSQINTLLKPGSYYCQLRIGRNNIGTKVLIIIN